MITGSLNRCLIVFVLLFSSILSFAQGVNQETIIYGPKVLKPGLTLSQKYSVSLPARVDSQTTHKIKIVNADGANHDLVTCNQKNILQKLSCVLGNVVNEAYILIYRVQDLSVSVNGVQVASINSKVAGATFNLSLKAQNQIEFKVSGSPLSYATVSIIEVSTKDTEKSILLLVNRLNTFG